MSPKQDERWQSVALDEWQRHYGVAHPLRILLLLQRDHPEARYRVRDGRIDVLTRADNDEE